MAGAVLLSAPELVNSFVNLTTYWLPNQTVAGVSPDATVTSTLLAVVWTHPALSSSVMVYLPPLTTFHEAGEPKVLTVLLGQVMVSFHPDISESAPSISPLPSRSLNLSAVMVTGMNFQLKKSTLLAVLEPAVP